MSAALDTSTPRADRSVELPDGRRLGFAEYGDPEGRPVFFFHGFPGSRLDYRLVDSGEHARSAGARVIAPDRPGVGLSDPLPGRALVDWAKDVTSLADALEVERFAVLGLSGGGPFAAACAHELPRRVAAAGIVSGMGPAGAPGTSRGVSWTIPGKPALFRRVLLWLMRMGVEKNPARVLDQTKETLAPEDRALFEEPAFGELFLDGLREALGPTTAGALHDAATYTRPWGFRLEDISVPVLLWHGGTDLNVPISVARWVSESIPDCTAVLDEREGHLSLPCGRFRQILDALVRW